MTGLSGGGHAKPPLSGRRIAGEIIAGTVMGGALGLFLGYCLPLMDPMASMGLLLGWIVGDALGVCIAGLIGEETGSFWVTLAGSFLGLPVCIAGVGVLGLTWHNLPPVFGLSFVSAVFATMGFNLTRRHRSPPAGTSGCPQIFSTDWEDVLIGIWKRKSQR